MNYAALILWLSKLGADAPRLIELARGILKAGDILTGWAAVKQFGDAAVPYLADFPLNVALDADSEKQVEAQVQQLGVDTAGLKDLLPVFELLLPLLLQWFKNRQQG